MGREPGWNGRQGRFVAALNVHPFALAQARNEQIPPPRHANWAQCSARSCACMAGPSCHSPAVSMCTWMSRASRQAMLR